MSRHPFLKLVKRALLAGQIRVLGGGSEVYRIKSNAAKLMIVQYNNAEHIPKTSKVFEALLPYGAKDTRRVELGSWSHELL